MSEQDVPVTFEEFRRLVAAELNVEESRVVPEASFVDDLFADSIRLVELLLHLSQRGVTIPLQEAWSVRTVGDAYRLYADRGTKDAPPPPEAT